MSYDKRMNDKEEEMCDSIMRGEQSQFIDRKPTLRTPIFGEGSVIEIKEGWDGAGRKGKLLCIVEIPHHQDWGVVIWDDDPDEPDLHKLVALKELKKPEKRKEEPLDDELGE